MRDEASTLGIASGTVGAGRRQRERRQELGQESLPEETPDAGPPKTLLSSIPRSSVRPSDKLWRSPFWEGDWKDIGPSAKAVPAPSQAP